MADKKEDQKESITCLEDIPFPEMIGMMLGQEEAGSLSGFLSIEMMGEMIVLDAYQAWFFTQVAAHHYGRSPCESENSISKSKMCNIMDNDLIMAPTHPPLSRFQSVYSI
jgi:hypothetical protein